MIHCPLHLRLAGVASLLLVLLSHPAVSKPASAASIEEGVNVAVVVALVEYLDWTAGKPVEYYEPPIAKYKVVHVLKGTYKDTALSVPYELHDGSACQAPENFVWDPKTMPMKGSRFFLLLKADTELPGEFKTYRGEFGRLAATPENEKRLQQLLNSKSAPITTPSAP